MYEPLLSAEAMRAADERTIHEYGVPGFALMESAGRAAAERAIDRYGPAERMRAIVWVGKGNNGGDGLVVARQLYLRGARVRVIMIADVDGMNEDPARNFRLLQRLAERPRSDRLSIEAYDETRTWNGSTEATLHVDGLLGTGLTSELRSPVREVVDRLNASETPVLALDVPTGIDSDRGEVLGSAVRADATVTMGALKTGLILGEGPRHTGSISVAEIGIPPYVLDETADEYGCPRSVDDRTVRSWLPRRRFDAHKYEVGMVLALAGSTGLTGAPVMASTAAARIGAGAVVCATPRPVQDVLAQKMTEVMTLGLPATRTGGLAPDALDEEPWIERLERARCLLVGCGLGRDSDTQETVRRVLRETSLPLVLDADGLNALVGRTDLLTEHADGRVVLTPHPGEFRRLVPGEVGEAGRVEAARTYARRWNCVLMLKGAPSVVGTPEGSVFVNRTGNGSVASAGTGDVLAGWCAGLLAQGLSPERAAVAALHVGGAVADAYVRDNDARSLMATDLIELIPRVLKRRFSLPDAPSR